jgi:adenylate cyclase
MRRLSTSFKTYPEYNPADWLKAPKCFQASFDANSQNYMQILNNQVGVILQNAELLAEVKRHEIYFKDSLNS